MGWNDSVAGGASPYPTNARYHKDESEPLDVYVGEMVPVAAQHKTHPCRLSRINSLTTLKRTSKYGDPI